MVAEMSALGQSPLSDGRQTAGARLAPRPAGVRTAGTQRGGQQPWDVAEAAAGATQDVERLRDRLDSEYEATVAPAKVPPHLPSSSCSLVRWNRRGPRRISPGFPPSLCCSKLWC